jgi:hypothetical protein
MSRAEDLFRMICDGGLTFINSMISTPIVEELFLDYKQASTIPPATLSDSDKKNYAKAISGFSNSEGGVIVWGVDCRKDPTSGADIPSKLVPIPNVMAFKTMLDALTSGATLPPNRETESHVVLDNSGTDGFLITLIPEAEGAPFKAVIKGTDDYYMRAGSSFLPVTHGLLAGMFGRKPSPRIEGSIELHRAISVPVDKGMLHFRLFVRNTGHGLAHDVHSIVSFFHTSAEVECSVLGTGIWEMRPFDSDGKAYSVTLLSTPTLKRMPPGESLPLMEIALTLPRHPQGDLRLHATFGSSEAAPTYFQFHLTQNQLERVSELACHENSRNSSYRHRELILELLHKSFRATSSRTSLT